MLVLTRKIGESVRIGSQIIVSISGIYGNSVRLAIGAPEEIKILRSELECQVEAGSAVSDALGIPCGTVLREEKEHDSQIS